MKSRSMLLLALLLAFGQLMAQDSLLTAIAQNNSSAFEPMQAGFKGEGWDKILAAAQKSVSVLIGEDHFTNEIPYFTSALASAIKFDNFFGETDPYSAKILQQKIKTLSLPAFKKYVADYGNTFSFYAFEPELALLQKLVKQGVHLNGTDQILLVGDRLICSELAKTTSNKRAKEIYRSIEINSKNHFEAFLKDQGKPFYLYTPDFDKNLNELASLPLSQEEKKLIEMLKLTAKIYKSGSHHLRVQLMKNQLMAIYGEWYNKKNLFKYGANHVAKGESLLEIFDIGNLVNNISDGQFGKSLHIMIIGRTGTQASPFKGFPAETIDENSGTLKLLQPFFIATEGMQWHCFDMHPLQEAIESGKLKIPNAKLVRIIKGYDYLVVIPKVSASQFPQ